SRGTYPFANTICVSLCQWLALRIPTGICPPASSTIGRQTPRCGRTRIRSYVLANPFSATNRKSAYAGRRSLSEFRQSGRRDWDVCLGAGRERVYDAVPKVALLPNGTRIPVRVGNVDSRRGAGPPSSHLDQCQGDAPRTRGCVA